MPDELLGEHPQAHLVDGQATIRSANVSTAEGTTSNEAVAPARGIGRSYWPNARVASRPTIEPIAIPIIEGASIGLNPAIIAIIGSVASSSSCAGGGSASPATRRGR